MATRIQMVFDELRTTNHELLQTDPSISLKLIMQNKPNFRKSQMNVSDYITKAYDKRTLGQRGKSKPNSNPNKPNSKISKSTLTLFMTNHYNKIHPILCQKNEPNPNPIQTQFRIREFGRKSMLIQTDFCKIIDVVRRKSLFLTI